MNVGLVIAAFNSGESLARTVDSAIDGRSDVRLELFLHSTHAPTVKTCYDIAQRFSECCLRDVGRNQGLSRSWNEGILAAYDAGVDVVVVANDDITFGLGDIDNLAAAALEHHDCYAVLCSGYHSGFNVKVPSHGFSCFALNRIALDVLGCFDENLFPAYFEDCDYSRRAVLANIPAAHCSRTNIVHEGSATIKRDPNQNKRNCDTFAANSSYYLRKWGGGPHQEVHLTPFRDPLQGLRIAPATRHAPYGPNYDRNNPEVRT